MDPLKLDLSSLQNALAALEKSVGYLRSELSRDPDLYEQFRAASIQAFEFTFEIAHKTLRRQLELMGTSKADVDQMTYMFAIRSAAEAGLIGDIARFRKYRDTRNITSHTYNPVEAEKVVAVLDDFIPDVRFILTELKRRNRADD